MKIALLSYAYAPSLGGIEGVTRLVADGLSDRGHEVTIITSTPGVSDDESRVTRRPSARALVRMLKDADAVIQSNVSVTLAWPLLLRLVRRPWVLVNHTPIARTDGRRTLRDRVKIATLPRHTYSVSRFLQEQTLPAQTTLMPNPYDDRVFHRGGRSQQPSPHHLLFVGRLAPVKGLDVLLHALVSLTNEDSAWRLTVVGDGPDRQSLQALTKELGLEAHVTFLGRRHGEELADEMRMHGVVVLPSREFPPEAFPLVPLEAVACGGVTVASSVGGLPESVGQRGVLVPPDDPTALAAALRNLVKAPGRLAALAAAESPIELHTISAVAQAYERALVRSR